VIAHLINSINQARAMTEYTAAMHSPVRCRFVRFGELSVKFPVRQLYCHLRTFTNCTPAAHYI